MKGDISKYEKEIKEFFSSKELEVNINSRELNSHSYKTQQCSVDIVLKERVMERRALGINPVSVIQTLAHFELIAMPGCCGIVISTNCWTLHRIQRFGIGQFLHQLRIKIAKEWGYSILMCTDVDSNTIQKHILEKNSWKQIQQFKNTRTNHVVNIHTLEL